MLDIHCFSYIFHGTFFINITLVIYTKVDSVDQMIVVIVVIVPGIDNWLLAVNNTGCVTCNMREYYLNIIYNS